MRIILTALLGLGLSSCGDAQDGPSAPHASTQGQTPAAPALPPTEINLETFSGEVTEANSKVSFEFEAEAGSLITVSTSSMDNFDTVLSVNAPDGRMLAENDDADGTLQSRIVFAAEESGTYRAVIGGFGNSTGSFDLHIRDGIDAGLSDQAHILGEELVTLTGQRQQTDHPVEVAAGQIFVATTIGLAPDMDTTLTLIGPNGVVLAQNDDRGDGSLNSQIVYQSDVDARLIVRTGSFNSASTGDLALSLAIDPEAEIPFDFATIEGEAIATYEGQIGISGEPQSYPLTLSAGETVLAMADTTSGDLDIVLRLLDQQGLPVAFNDDRGDGTLNSAFAYTAEADGEYTILVDRYQAGASTGGFSLVLSRVDASVVDLLQGLLDNIVSLSGDTLSHRTENFVVYYTLEGEDATDEAYALSVVEGLQHSYNEQIGRMGWAEPIRDQDGLYRAYIADAGGAMGVTYPVETTFDNPSTDVRETLTSRTVFVIENDFRGFEEKEAPVDSLMRATATHEFAHVVQFGYDSQEGLDWLYEATASWIETATVGVHQDASDYVTTDYEQPHLCWTTTESGFDYAQWTLLQSLVDVHGEDIVRNIWENAVELDGFPTMSATLENVGTTIPDALQRWRAQNFARDYALAPVFERAVRLHHTLNEPGRWVSKGGPQELGANYIALNLNGRYRFDLQANPDIELIALGHRGDRVEVVPLGNSGVVDTNDYDYAALMVFNRDVPNTPGDCSIASYTIETSPARSRPARAAYSFSAEHFQPLRPEGAQARP